MPFPPGNATTPLPAVLQWTPSGRALVFVLAAASIWCLLAEMYNLCSMRSFFYAVLTPATIALYALAALDRSGGTGQLFRYVMLGSLAGLLAAVAYDIFRLPFVFSDAWGLARLGVPQMPLFKVFPRFGALILGQPAEQPTYSTLAHLLGWSYHFSNGITFGVMFTALCAPAAPTPHATRGPLRNPILWSSLMALGIELCLLASPYTKFFNIPMTTRFVLVTIAAHLIFGLALGLAYLRAATRWPAPSPILPT